ncbi:hypothetical protein M409DRAFT_21428 [Zasmidium cellare ATCC 36951]|uniref:Uncharacterized protein n=1 Tax=Zasmidium cellare ATCC 36951 TaxID=1080233 RepID=A0A6A6CN48_ZASCE|nr:uncharacterized protein M409DRAFT_21428 [Zasmidium cellare ATCC 36951]KAF2168687.1 hypothetical protein M409DRAFT_21428 [Zasmidium cellare ATCC 36951]
MAEQPDLTTSVINAHGGMQRWEEVQSIELKLDWRGDALVAKGPPGYYHATCHIDTKNIKVTFQGLGHGNSDDRQVYTRKSTWIEHGGGTIIASRDNP